MKRKKTSYTVLIVVTGLIVLYGGCDRSYLPWNQSPWSTDNTQSQSHDEDERVEQAPSEDFCEELEPSIDDYRSFLEDDSLSESRRRNIRILIEQYDRECQGT